LLAAFVPDDFAVLAAGDFAVAFVRDDLAVVVFAREVFAVAFAPDDFAPDDFAVVDAPFDVFAPLDFAAAAAFVLREGFAFGALVAVAGGFDEVFAVADFGPAGSPGFAAPTLDGEPDVRRAACRAVPGVDSAAGVPGVFGADVDRRSSMTRLASSAPRVTASRPSPTAVSMMLFGFIAMRTVLPGPRGGYTARTGAGTTAASPQAMASASDAGMFVRNVPSISRSSPQARPRAGSEANPSSSMPPRGA
jgi:hypothetical protein